MTSEVTGKTKPVRKPTYQKLPDWMMQDGDVQIYNLQNALENTDVELHYLGNQLNKNDLNIKVRQYLDDSLEIYKNKYERIMNELDELDRELDYKISDYYTKYVEMPYMGNYSYMDPLNPLSLH